MFIYYFCFKFPVFLIPCCLHSGLSDELHTSFHSMNITLQFLSVSYCCWIDSDFYKGQLKHGLSLSEGQRGVWVCLPIKQWNETSAAISPPASSTHSSCWPHALTIQKSILGVQAPAILFSSTEREREQLWRGEHQGLALEPTPTPLQAHISSLRYPDHKVRNVAPYKGESNYMPSLVSRSARSFRVTTLK